MAELGWLRSSPAKVSSGNGSMSSSGGTLSFNGSSENLFDLLQGRLGSSSGGSMFGPSSSEHASPFFRSSDHQQMSDDTDSTSLLKPEDENHLQSTVEQLSMSMQPNLWPVSDTVSASPLLGSLGTQQHHHDLYNNAHIPSLHTATGMVVDTCQFSSFSTLKPNDPSPQLQALRDFMAYGNNNNAGTLGAQHHAATNMAGGIAGAPMFLHLGDESCSPGSSSLLQLPGMPGQMQRTFVDENSTPVGSNKPDMMAYRALCQTELFANERSPHRTQFQRENHILAERQRREEMNEKFSALRAMIPKATKKDKASIVGDTIGYVLELEKTLKHLQACKASRKGYFKLLKKKPSLKIANDAAADDDDCERSMTATASTPPADVDSCTAVAATAADDLSNHAVCTQSDDIISHQNPDEKQTCPDMDIFDDPVVSCTSAVENVTTCGDSFQQKDGDSDIREILPGGTVCNAEVDVQNLGEQAVIKIVCARSSGLVLRILLALDECKVDVLQSNVTTVAEKSVHFITVQICSGLSSTTEEMIAVLHKASSSPNG